MWVVLANNKADPSSVGSRGYQLVAEQLSALAGVPSMSELTGPAKKALEKAFSGPERATVVPKWMTALNERLQSVEVRRRALLKFIQAAHEVGGGEKGTPRWLVRLPGDVPAEPEVFMKAVGSLVGDFNRFALSVVGEGVKICGVERGSVWLVLVPAQGGAAVFALLTSVVATVYWLRKRRATAKKMEAEARMAGTEAELKAVLAETTKSLLRKTVEQFHVQHVTAKTKLDRQEVITNGVTLIQTLLGQFEKGARMSLPASASDEDKAGAPLEAGGLLDVASIGPVEDAKALPGAGPTS